jgi:hypothetical protein
MKAIIFNHGQYMTIIQVLILFPLSGREENRAVLSSMIYNNTSLSLHLIGIHIIDIRSNIWHFGPFQVLLYYPKAAIETDVSLMTSLWHLCIGDNVLWRRAIFMQCELTVPLDGPVLLSWCRNSRVFKHTSDILLTVPFDDIYHIFT